MSEKRYYLSTFEGDGSADRPYVPAVAAYGSWCMIDCRKDRSQAAGWSLVCVESDAHPVAGDAHAWGGPLQFYALGSDLDSALDWDVREQLRLALDFDFRSVSLRNIIVETQLCHSDIMPDGNGVFRVEVLDEVWVGDQEETLAFIASCRCPHRAELVSGEVPSLDAVKASTLQAIAIIQMYYDFEAAPGERLADVRGKARGAASPLVAAIERGLEMAMRDDPLLFSSRDAAWLASFAFDLQEIGPRMVTRRAATRLRNPGAIESFKYEAMVIAAYARQGAGVTFTDDEDAKSPECNVVWAGVPAVHIECKLKTPETLRARNAQAKFEVLASRICELLKESGRSWQVRVQSRFDPSDEDVVEIVEWLQELVTTGGTLPQPVRKRGGKLIEVVEQPVLSVGVADVPGVPLGYDFSRCDVDVDETGRASNGRSFVWSTQQRWHWVKSAIQTVKDTKQLPRDEPSVLYLCVPAGPFEVVWLRTEIIAHNVEALLAHDCGRISAVVVTGEATRMMKDPAGGPEVASLSTVFKVVVNEKARNPLPLGFRLLGRDFTRR